jgi:hypothetical protein
MVQSSGKVVEKFLKDENKENYLKNLITKKIRKKYRNRINRANCNKDKIELFKRNLILRVLSKPEENKIEGIELARRIVQLILISYRITFTKEILKDIIRICSSNNARQYIVSMEKILINSGINQDKFIYFCYWYLKIFPAGGIFKAIFWIIKDSIFSMDKYLVNDKDLFITSYNFVKSTERGLKLISLVKHYEEKKEDKVFQKILNL